MKNNSQLFYVCSLVEYIGRTQKKSRSEIVNKIGKDNLQRIYDYADILHCEPIEKVADEYIQICLIDEGKYDNLAQAKYRIPDYWTIGEVYERLIEDIGSEDIIDVLTTVFNSWISDAICDYNTDFYYQSRDYIYQCYLAEKVL